MGRPKLTEKRIRQTLYIPEPTWARVRLLLLDPMTGNLKHGALSKLMTQLLNEWVAKQMQAQAPAPAQVQVRGEARDAEEFEP